MPKELGIFLSWRPFSYLGNLFNETVQPYLLFYSYLFFNVLFLPEQQKEQKINQKLTHNEKTK